MTILNWNPATTPKNIGTALKTLAADYPLCQSDSSANSLVFKEMSADGRSYRLTRTGDSILVEYSDLAAALRGVSAALAGEKSVAEDTSFTMFAIMLDCSRNAVMKVSHLKSWLRKLALLGYNMVMLYTEDTYELPGEPYFGYKRGAYSEKEICDIDAYADQLGIELIPCIQTLGHLTQILRWPEYSDIKDTSSVMLVDADKTYSLIEKMIKFASKNFKTNRIHIGLDETHDLGRGKFMDKFGYERGFDIFNRHLARVNNICASYDLKPMIWSDMYFRMGSKAQDYYDKDCVIPDEVKAQIPSDVELVYWDYYHDNEEFYLDWIQRHRDLGFEPIMGSGIWTWVVPWYGHELTELNAGPCISASRKAGLKEIFFTMWGDDGAYCDFDSAMAGLAWSAQLAYAGNVDDEKLASRFLAVTGAHLEDSLSVTDLYKTGGVGQGLGMELLWDDPLLRIFWHNTRDYISGSWSNAKKTYLRIIEKIKSAKTTTTAGGDLEYALSLTQFFVTKIDLLTELDAAYKSCDVCDKSKLENVLKNIPFVIDSLDKLTSAFRKQWLARNKPQGLETMQIRFAGQRCRFEELALRLSQFISGEIDNIEELEHPEVTPFNFTHGDYHHLATGSAIS